MHPPANPDPPLSATSSSSEEALRAALAAECAAREAAEARIATLEQQLDATARDLHRKVDERSAELLEITERLMSEVSVRERTERRLAARYRAERAVMEGLSPLDMARRVIGELSRLLGWDGGSFWWRDEESLICVDGVAGRDADALRFWSMAGARVARGQELPGEVWATGAAAWRHGRMREPALAKLHDGFSTYCAFPIAAGETVDGVLMLVSRAPQLPDGPLLDDLAEVGRAFGRAVERRAATERLHIATSRLGTLISNLAGAILLEDETRQIVLVNQPFVDLFGLQALPDALVGTDCGALTDAARNLFEDPDGFAGGIDTALALRQPEIGRILDLADGRVLERDFVPVIEGGRYLGNLWHYRDVTERIRYQGELEEARERAEAGTRAKSAFLATMSHEIRTPLNAVINMSELLLDTPLTEDQQRLATAAGRAGRSLAEIVNDILDFSKIEAGRLSIELVPMDPVDLLQGVHAAYAPIALQRGLRLELVIDPQAPRCVSGDPVRIRQVATNLVGNALKFTPEGGITIGLDVGFPGATTLMFWVRDTGIGISAEARGRLFQPFSQADSSTTRVYGGTGLGLAISRELVGRMGGQIDVESEPGRGSLFWFELPLVPVAAPVATPAASAGGRAGSEGAGTRPCVLVADDNELNREVIVALLRRVDVEVRLAGDGQAALDLLAAGPVDLVLMDCQMPVLDGIAATRELRRREGPTGRRVPVVALTADARVEVRDACAGAGMDDFLVKPIERDALDRVIERWVGLRPAAAADRETSAPAPIPPAGRSRPVLDLQTFRAIEAAVGANGRFRTVLVDNVDRLAARVATALSDLDGAPRIAELAAAGHAIAGVAAQAGARELEALAREIEQAARVDPPDVEGVSERAAGVAAAVERFRAALPAGAPVPGGAQREIA